MSENIKVDAIGLAAEVAELRRENAELRQALADMPTCRCGLSTDEQCALSVENAALREDKARLNWLEGQIRCGFYNHATGRTELSALSCHHVKTIGIRAVIDSKRKEAQP